MKRSEKAKHSEQLSLARTTLQKRTGVRYEAPGPNHGRRMKAADYVATYMPGRRSSNGRAAERKLVRQGYEPTQRGSMVRRVAKNLLG